MVGLAHDYLLVMRGAERTFAAMADCWPAAPILTTLYDEAGTQGVFAGRDVRSSPLQRLGTRQSGFRRLLPLFPWAVSRLDAREFDVLVTSSSAFAHGIAVGPDAAHVWYCHSPFRYAWHERATGLAEQPPLLRPAVGVALDAISRWDLRAASRVTRIVANSAITRERVAEFYGRDSVVVHPPVAVERFAVRPPAPEDWCLIVCELVAHKRVDLALEAAARVGVAVRVVGEGPERERWTARFPTARFLGRVDDAELEGLMARAAALLVPNVEEFGIAAVEAQAAGRPVLAVDAGGARETVIDGTTGLRLAPDVDVWAQALRDLDLQGFDVEACRANARRFNVARFQDELRREVAAATG